MPAAAQDDKEVGRTICVFSACVPLIIVTAIVEFAIIVITGNLGKLVSLKIGYMSRTE